MCHGKLSKILLSLNLLVVEYHKISGASNGEEALEILAHEYVDILIVDIQMPKMNGYELMHSLRDSGDLRPAIMLTAMNTFCA